MLPSWFLHDTVKTSIRNCNFPPFSRSVRNREKQYYEKLHKYEPIWDWGKTQKQKTKKCNFSPVYLSCMLVFFMYMRLYEIRKSGKNNQVYCPTLI